MGPGFADLRLVRGRSTTSLLRAGPAAKALVGVVGLGLGCALSVQAEPGVPVNPVRPVSPADAAADPSHHFLVLVETDARLYQNESEGTVLVGGDVSWRGYQVVPKTAPYTIPGEDAPAGLVVLGAIDFAGSTGGRQTLTVQEGTNGYFAGLDAATVVREGGVTHVVPPGGDAGTRPGIDVHRPQTEESMRQDPGFDVPALFATYRQLAAEIAACPTTVRLLDQNGDEPWPGSGVATVRLRPGQNVLNTTVAQFADLPNLNLAPGSPPLGEATLIINVTDTGSYDWPVPNLGFQGASNASYILWNLAATGTVTLPPTESDTVWGTVYAPDAELVDHSTANIEGNVVVRELEHGGQSTDAGGDGGGAGEDGGEIHDTPFLGTVTPCGETSPPTTTTGPTTTEPTTTEPTTTEPTTTEPTTTDPTTTDPTTTEHTTTEPHAPAPGGGANENGDRLPATGAAVTWYLAGGSILTATGAGLLLAARRRARPRTR